MADDLDQGYMQTRQTMRDWQNRMLFMEPTQDGADVRMGVGVGVKPDAEQPAPSPPPQAPVTLAPDATLPPEQPQAQQPNTITVDTPEVAAVKQQFSAHMQEVASGEAGMKALGKGGKALAEAARPGFETAAIALGMDEEAAATVGQAFVEFMGGLPSDDSTDLQAGFETAIAVLPAVGAMYKSGKMVGKAAVEGLTKNRDAIIQEFRKAGDILKSERGSVPLGGGSGKPLVPEILPATSHAEAPIARPTSVPPGLHAEVNSMVSDFNQTRAHFLANDLPIDAYLDGKMTLAQLHASIDNHVMQVEGLTVQPGSHGVPTKKGVKEPQYDDVEMQEPGLIEKQPKPQSHTGIQAEPFKRIGNFKPNANYFKEAAKTITGLRDEIRATRQAYGLGGEIDIKATGGAGGKPPTIPPPGAAAPGGEAGMKALGGGGAGKPPDVPLVNIGGAAEEPMPLGGGGAGRGLKVGKMAVGRALKELSLGDAQRLLKPDDWKRYQELAGQQSQPFLDAAAAQTVKKEMRSLEEKAKRAYIKTLDDQESAYRDSVAMQHPEVADMIKANNAALENFVAELTAQRRGPVLSDAQVIELAKKSDMTWEHLLDLPPGAVLNPEQTVKVRQMFHNRGTVLIQLAEDALASNAPEDYKAMLQQFVEMRQATVKIVGPIAESGRVQRLQKANLPLSAEPKFTMEREPQFRISEPFINQLYGMLTQAQAIREVAPGALTPERLALMISKLKTPEQLMAFARKMENPTWWDMAMEVWINGLLSGPITHSTNIISNAATLAWNIPERAVASMLNPKAVRPGEAAAMLGGVVESMGDAWRLAWKAFKEEQPQFGQAKLEMPRRAITADALEVTGMTGRAVDFLGAAVRLPGRFLMAGDDFFKAIAFRAELRALAKRQAFREINEMSLTGKAAAQKAREIEKNILDNPPDSIKEAAQEFAAYTTFTRDLGETGQKVQALASTPIGRIVLPFVRTPTNIFKFAGERTPLALASRAVREEIAAGGERRALALAKIGLGSMTMAYMSTLAANGLITGGGPKDKTLRQIKMQTGWKPYSFKIGNEYISYARIEPLGSLFGLAADAADIMGQLSEADAAKLASALTVAISRNVAQKTFVKGLAGTLSAVTSQEVKQVNSFLEKELPTILPYSSALGQTAKNVDPVMREVNSIMDAFKAKLPGYSSDLPPHRNLWGEPVLLEGGLGPDLLSPFYSSTVKDDKVAAELDRLQAPITLPSKQIDRVPLTPKQYDRYQILAAQPQGKPSLREKLEEVIASDLYKHGTDDPADGGKITLLKMWVNNYRDLAKFQLRQEDADLDAKLRERETKKAGAFAGTAPGGLSR